MATKSITGSRTVDGAAGEIGKVISGAKSTYNSRLKTAEKLGRAAVNADPAKFVAPSGSRRVPGLSTSKGKRK